MQLHKAIGWLGLGIMAFLGAGPAGANNLVVTNVGLTWKNEALSMANVVFDLSWDNSWRGGENRDAAWVFVKFRAPGSNNWQHAALSAASAEHTPGAGATLDAVPDGKGVFIYRNADYTGSVSYIRNRLQWNYGSNGYAFARGATIEVAVLAIEMVYIPEGPFYLGSGGGEPGHFYEYPTTNQIFLITNETCEIPIGQTNGFLYYVADTSIGDYTGIVSNSFPKGYAAFYCMKYEITQGQYADFLNLSQNAYYNSGMGITRDTAVTPYLYTATAPNRAANYLYDGPGPYADWSALRPLSELEYEKACRGPVYPVPNEYAWGSTVKTQLTSFAGTEGSGTETALPATANYRYLSGQEADNCLHRVGIFSTTNSSREQAGASYYGAMEMTGNAYERYVSVGTTVSRRFRGTLGDGELSTANSDWPACNNFNYIHRGGSRWVNSEQISGRGRDHYDRGGATGGRVGRQAP